MSHPHRLFRSTSTLGLAVLLAAATLSAVSAPLAVAVPAATPCTTGTPITGDYNGDGSADLAVEATDYRDGRNLFVSTTRSTSGTWLDLDGYRIRSANLNGDICADAVVESHSGGVTVISLVAGTRSGLDAANSTAVDLPQSDGLAADTQLGATAVGFSHDGKRQLVVAGYTSNEATPSEDSAFMDVFTLDAAGAPGTPQVIDLDALGIPAIDGMAADGSVLVVGTPGESVNGKQNAGAVHVFIPDTADPKKLVHSDRITQATAGVAGTPEKFDAFGLSIAVRDGRLAIGVDESIGKAAYAGQVQLMRWNAGSRRFSAVRAINQGTKGVVGTNESFDLFGRSLVIARGLTYAGSYDVVIGTPGEGVGKAREAGAVTVGSFDKPKYRVLTQNTKRVPGSAENRRVRVRPRFAPDLGNLGHPGHRRTFGNQRGLHRPGLRDPFRR